MFKFQYLKFILLFMLILFQSCSTISTDNTKGSIKFRHPINSMSDDVLISFVIDGINFGRWQKKILENAVNIARRYNLTFDLGVVASHLPKKNKETYKVYEDNKDIFEIIANGFNYANPVESKRTGEFFDISIKKEIPVNLQEEKIKNMKEIFEKDGITTGTSIFLVPYYAGDEDTIKISEKYGYKLIIQENIKSNNLVENYDTITVSKCYINIPNRVNITDRDINYMKNRMQKFMNSRIKRIYVVFHPVNFNSPEALRDTEKFINEISFKFKTANVFYGMISDGVR